MACATGWIHVVGTEHDTLRSGSWIFHANRIDWEDCRTSLLHRSCWKGSAEARTRPRSPPCDGDLVFEIQGDDGVLPWIGRSTVAEAGSVMKA